MVERAKLLDVFNSCPDSTERGALNAPSLNANYICSNKGSLIGKYFKSLAQPMPFTVFDVVPQDVIHGWTTLGGLVVLLCHTEITNLEVCLVDFIDFLIQTLTLKMTGNALLNNRTYLERDISLSPNFISFPSTCLHSQICLCDFLFNRTI